MNPNRVFLAVGGIMLCFGFGLSIGYISEGLSHVPGSQVASVWCNEYDECYETYEEEIYAEPAMHYESSADPWYVFPEDQSAPPPPPEDWYWTSEPAVEVVDTVEPAWLFTGHDDPYGAPVYYEDPSYGADPYYKAPYYYDDPYAWEPLAGDDGYYWYGEPEYVVVEEKPWYVEAFPGIGAMVQQIIPGLSSASRPVVQPVYTSPPQRVTYPQPSCWVSAQPMRVAYGGSSMISWSAFNAQSASMNEVGAVPVSGSRAVSNIVSPRTFSLSVAGQGGSGSCYTRVEVEAQAAPVCMISANPSVLERGKSANLAWGSQNAARAVLSEFGSVPVQGGRVVQPSGARTYTLTVYNSSGQSKACSVYVNVF